MAYCVNGCWTVSNRIGIGTETPSTALHIVGVHTSGLGIINAISSDSSILNLDSATADARVRLKYQGGERWFAGMSDTGFNYTIQNGNNGCTGFSVSYSSNFVGISTCTPTNKLHVYSTTSQQGLTVENTLRNISCFKSVGEHSFLFIDSAHQCIYQPAIFFQRATTTYSEIRLQRASSSDSLGSYTESEGVVGTVLNTPFSIQSCGVRRIFLDTSGNVGLGTISPAVKLHVYGSHVGGRGILELQSADDALIAMRKSSGNSGMRFQDFNGNDRWFVGESNDCNIYFMDCFNTAKIRFAVTRPGNVGINTCTPETTLHMTADSPYVFIDDTSTASNRKRIKLVAGDVGVIQSFSIAFSCTNNTCQVDAMFVTENASVGINTSTPGTYKLNVNGAFYAAGSSKEYKTSICEYNTDSCMFMKLKPVTYDYKEEWKHLGKELKSGTQIGLIAEDPAEVFPELAVLKEEENEEKVVRNVDYEKLSIILLSEVQKLRKEVDDLKTNNNE